MKYTASVWSRGRGGGMMWCSWIRRIMTEQVLERVTPRLEALVNPGGLVVVETRKSGGLVPGWESVFARTYGDTGVRISRRGDETQ